jgi:hypothetical protein
VRPDDYHPSRLAHQGALSFHKFDDTDPIDTYNTWFKAHDEHLKPKQNPNQNLEENKEVKAESDQKLLAEKVKQEKHEEPYQNQQVETEIKVSLQKLEGQQLRVESLHQEL